MERGPEDRRDKPVYSSVSQQDGRALLKLCCSVRLRILLSLLDHFNVLSGMGFHCLLSHDVTLTNVAVRKRGSRPMSITADASHFESCSGTVHLDNVYFSGQGDDCLNVHGKFLDVRGIAHDLAANTTVITIGGAPHGGNGPGAIIGEVYRFKNRSTWASEGAATLTAVFLRKWTFKPALPDVTMFALLTAAALEPQVLVENSYFGNNRARGNLLKTSHVMVRNNTYHYSQGPCIQAHPDGACVREHILNIIFRLCFVVI